MQFSILQCSRHDERNILLFQVGCEKVIIETDNVAKGLEELVTLHNITELVMGAAADGHFSKYGSVTKSSVSPRANFENWEHT